MGYVDKPIGNLHQPHRQPHQFLPITPDWLAFPSGCALAYGQTRSTRDGEKIP